MTEAEEMAARKAAIMKRAAELAADMTREQALAGLSEAMGSQAVSVCTGVDLDRLTDVIRDAIGKHCERIEASEEQAIYPLVFSGDIRGTVCHAGHPSTAVGFIITIGGGIPEAWRVPRCPRCDQPVNAEFIQDSIDYGHWDTSGHKWRWCAGPKESTEQAFAVDPDTTRVVDPVGANPEEATAARCAGDAGTDR